MHPYTDLGMGGLLAILIIREVFGFLKSQVAKKNGAAPPPCPLNATIELWELKLSKGVVSGMKESLEPHFQRQSEILTQLSSNQGKIIDVLTRKSTIA
jgi:hypothetical protein